MGADRTRVVIVRRPKWRAYLLLSRISNLPTVWSNVLAGTVASRAPFHGLDIVLVSVAVSLLYTAGMFLNDAFDRAFDATRRTDRPLPMGDVTRAEVFGIGFALLAAGELLLAWTATPSAVLWGLALAATILYYDYRHKRDPFGPVVMGLCRGLVYCVSAAAVMNVEDRLSPQVMLAAVVVTLYVVGLTWIAKKAGPRAGWLMPLLIAGISLVDAVVVGLNGGGLLTLVAAAGFVLTLVFQRVVPGT